MRASTRASGPLRSGKCVGHGMVSSWWEDVAQARQHARHHRRGRGGEADQSCAVAIFVAKPISGTEAVRARGFQYSKRCGGMCTGTSCGRAVGASQEIGRASCRERVCQNVSISGVGVSLKKQKKKKGEN